MAQLSAFDVLGPNMIGPSSSHTAGAAVIAYLAQKMINGPIIKATFTLYGSFAHTYSGHGTDRALLGGLLGFHTDDKRIRDSHPATDLFICWILSESHPNAALNIILYRMTPSPIFTQTLWIS